LPILPIIEAIRVQDISRGVWYSWDRPGPWDPSEPEVTVGSGKLYIAFYVINRGDIPGMLRLEVVDDTGKVLATTREAAAPGAGVGIEAPDLDMPDRSYNITLTATPTFGAALDKVEFTIKPLAAPPPPPSEVSLMASKTEDVLPGEIVEFTTTVSPAKSVDYTLKAYDSTGKLTYTSYEVTNDAGVGTVRLVPSVIDPKFSTWQSESEGKLSNVVKVTIKLTPTPPTSITLDVSNPTPDMGEMVTFTATTEPPVTESTTLYAYVGGAVKGEWHLPIVNGTGTIRLVPSEVGEVVDWKVVDSFGVESNVVRTTVSEPPPPPATKGTLKVDAYADGEPVAAEVEIVGVGTYTTPFSLDLDPETYTLKATYDTQVDIKTATVREGETTSIVFHFSLPQVWPGWWPLAAAAGGVAVIAVVGLVVYQERKKEEMMYLMMRGK